MLVDNFSTIFFATFLRINFFAVFLRSKGDFVFLREILVISIQQQ